MSDETDKKARTKRTRSKLPLTPKQTKMLEAIQTAPVRPQNMDAGAERKYTFLLKELAWDFERDNYQFIVFYHREKKWWQTGDNSMLIYYYHASKQLSLRDLKIRHDNDYNEKTWKTGYITTSRIETVVRNLQFLKYKLIVDTEEFKVFMIPRPILPDDMEIWQNSEREKEKRFNMLVVPKNIYPRILSRSAILHREVINKTANLSPARQKYYGDQGAELVAWISYNAIAMSNGRMDAMEYFEGALKRLDQMNDWLAYVKKFDLFNIDTDIRIIQEINELKAMMSTELAALMKGAERRKRRAEREKAKVGSEEHGS